MSLIATIQEQLQEVDELISRLEGSVATKPEPRPSVSANIRALEKERRVLQQEFFRAAALAEVDVYRYRIINTQRATIEGLTGTWREFQHMLSAVYDSLKTGGAKKPRTKGAKDAPTAAPSLELGFGYSFHGSVGIAMTLPQKTEGLFPDALVQEATNHIFDVVSSVGDPVKLATIARRLGPTPVQAVYKWVDAHVQNRFGVGIEWRRDEEHRRSVTVQFEEFAILREDLARTTTEARIQGPGDLVIVDTVDNLFTMKMDDGSEIVGTFTNAITKDQAARVPARYDAAIIKSTKVVSIGGEIEAETYFLEALTPL